MLQWLLHTHSIQDLNQGGGVLDVAGGRGELSFQLHVRGVRATCVDRRVCKPCKAMLKYVTPTTALPPLPRITPSLPLPPDTPSPTPTAPAPAC